MNLLSSLLKFTANQIARLDGRVDDVVSSATVDSELIDIRNGMDGTHYPSAGAAVRGQYNGLNTKYDALTNNLNIYKVAKPLDAYNQPTNGTDGQLLRTKGNGRTEWANVGQPTDEQTAQAVSDWLDAHPEATTTVQDGSLTDAKFSNSLKLSTIKDYVTPQMYGAVSYTLSNDPQVGGIDSSQAFQDMIDACEYGSLIVIPAGIYYLKNVELKNGIRIFGTGNRSILKLPDTAINGDCILHEADTSYGSCTLKDIVLDGNKSHISSSLVCNGITNKNGSGGYNKYDNKFIGVIFRNFTGSGLYYESQAMEYLFDACIFSNNLVNGAYFATLYDTKMCDCNFDANGLNGLYANGSTLKLVNIKCYKNGTYQQGSGLYLSGLHHSIDNVEVQENYYDGATFTGLNDSQITINANNNNHRDCVDGAQVRITNSKNNRFDILISGAYMRSNIEPIVEKNGVVEIGYANSNNLYYVKINETPSQYISNNMQMFATDCKNLSNTYILDDDEWFNEDAKNIDFSTTTKSVSYATGGAYTVLDGGRTIRVTGTSNATAAYSPIIQLNLNSLFTAEELQAVRAGDLLYINCWAKNINGKKMVWSGQEVVDGSYINLTTLNTVNGFGTKYQKILGVFSFPKGYDEASNTFTLALRLSIVPVESTAAGVTLSMDITKCKAKIQHNS